MRPQMTDPSLFHLDSPLFLATNNNNHQKKLPPDIPIEIVSDEEMALIEAALAAATRPSLFSSSTSALCSASSSSSHLHGSTRSIGSVSLLAKRGFTGFNNPDIEDSGNYRNTQHKKTRLPESLLQRFRNKRGLYVTDITATEWCEKQMEFILLVGKRKTSKAMAAGTARHSILEKEVVKKVRVDVASPEDSWALKFLNFIIGVNQLLFEGLTRELPIIGFTEGVWMVGVIDEIRMPIDAIDRKPMLVDIKTRVRDTLPSVSQKRNGRLQLMCYKHLWDNLDADNFPYKSFFDFFTLNPYYILSEDIREITANSGFPAKTLDDLIRYYKNTCSMLPPAHNQLLLRYEFQKDNSLLGEDQFAYDSEFVKNQIKGSLEFWMGEREANYVSEAERWKCQFCDFSSACLANSSQPGSSPASPSTNHSNTPPS